MVELKDFLAGIELQKAEIVYAFTKLRFAYSIKHQNERFYNAMARQIATSIICKKLLKITVYYNPNINFSLLSLFIG